MKTSTTSRHSSKKKKGGKSQQKGKKLSVNGSSVGSGSQLKKKVESSHDGSSGHRRHHHHSHKKSKVSTKTRNIFMFLCLNFAYMFVEVIFGYLTNSIGLISDAGHMLFDCLAIFITLVASRIADERKDDFNFGYERVETVAGFVNGLFIVFIALFVVIEAVERLAEPPEIHTHGLLMTSVGGLLVNLVGVLFFHDHAHLEGESCSHHGHGHSHGHSHSHGGDNVNFHGMYLHIMADLLGSVGVVLSSVLIEWKGWHISDPIASLCIAALVLISVFPLLKQTAPLLLLKTTSKQDAKFEALLEEIKTLPGVYHVSKPIILPYTSAKKVISFRVLTDDEMTDESALREDVSALVEQNYGHKTYLSIEIVSN